MSVPADQMNGAGTPDPNAVGTTQIPAREAAIKHELDIPDDVSVEEHATFLGWVPQEQYKGDPSKWRPAEEFVRYGEKNRLVLKGEVKRLSQTVAEQKKALDEARQAAKEMREFIEGTSKAIASNKRAGVIEQIRLARESGDVETEIGLQSQLTELDRQINSKPEETKPPPQAQEHPSVTRFRSENTWFDEDPVLGAEGFDIAKRLLQTGKYGDPNGGRLDVDKVITDMVTTLKARFPTHAAFASKPNGAGNGAATVTPDPRGGTVTGSPYTQSGGVRSKTPTYENLPPDAKAQADMFFDKQGMDKNKYAARYFEAYPEELR